MKRRGFLKLVTSGAPAVLAMPALASSTPVRLGVIGISFHAVVGGVVEQWLDRLQQPYTLTQAPHDRMFEALGRGEIDLLIAAWLPGTHSHLAAPVADRIEIISTVYKQARLFWAVPAYVPAAEVASIADLVRPTVAARMDKAIYSIGPSAGLSVRSAKSIEEYGLAGQGYTLLPGDTARWIGTFRERYAASTWHVMPLWQPQFLNRTHRLRALADPRSAMGEADDAVIVSTRAFASGGPAPVIDALRQIRLDIEAVTAMDLLVNMEGMPAKAAAGAWMAANPGRLGAPRS